ncbi:hypothetical protein EVS84_23210 [Pseudomonas koreensis]|uniref:Uncharacterized protein n=2 Tax=Pseudomonas TaxID=286 RepID=A0A4Q4KX99_9PSED|nr:MULTISPECIES: hypothetical protein [Pseudomonas]KIF59183.1 hypothetical protein NX10_16620 [Pseudomonas fluorescens]MDM8193031.1 hypothetical protein [Pseudomonas fluorescens]MDP8574276.1 hypothetical protein [Pseudomonas iranensis]MDR7055813.1 hypothetical protein [Pseudomonas koreensis]RYM38648.1 hypothetical protein EVS84_23210 [Pseudomonas koreensis]
MTSNIEKSFIATLRMFDHRVGFLEHLYGKPAMATISLFSGGFYTGRPQIRDQSHLLGIRINEQSDRIKPLKLHFGHTPDGYILTVKNQGPYFNQVISNHWLDTVEAVKPDTDSPSKFVLLDRYGTAITRDNLQAEHTPVCLKLESHDYLGGIKIRSLPYVYLGKTEERSKITFILSVVERHVPDIKR